MVELILFYFWAAVIIIAAIFTVISKNIYYSALWLGLTLFGVAGIFVLLNAYFLAGIQVLIYIGAVVVLTIFVINLTKEITGKLEKQHNKQVIPALISCILCVFLIISAVLKTDWATRIIHTTADDKTAKIGNLLLNDFVLPFEFASVLLLVALIGAIVIVSSDKENGNA